MTQIDKDQKSYSALEIIPTSSALISGYMPMDSDHFFLKDYVINPDENNINKTV